MSQKTFKPGDLCIYHKAGSQTWQVVKITGSNNGVIRPDPQFYRAGSEDFGPAVIPVEYQTDPKVAPYAVDHAELREVTEHLDNQIEVSRKWLRELGGASRFHGKSLTLIHLDKTVSQIGPKST